MTEKKEREELILRYAYLVKNIVERMALKLPSHVDKQDLVNVGVIGLMSALEKFDQGRNVPFEVYAKFRIRGAILDELRARDFVSRSARQKNTRIENTFQELQKKLGRLPADEEVADYLGVPLEDYYDMLEEARGISVLSSDDLPPDYCEKHSQYDFFEKPEQNDPFSLMARNQLKALLHKAIEALPEKEKIVLSLYYYEELTLKEIGKVLDLTESRICQIHTKAVLKLRGSLKNLREQLN